MKTSFRFSLLTLLLASSLSAYASAYPGNGASGFGGPVGTGSLTINDSLSGMSITLNRGAGNLNDDLVLYLDTQPGGFADTSAFSDNGDGGRTAISGFNSGNPSRTIASFPNPFGADYAVSIENGFIGVFGLASGGNNSLNYLFGQSQSGINSDPSYTINITAAQMAQIGLTPGSGQTFFFVGSLISTSAYRSDETIGPSVSSGNPGFGTPLQFTGDLSYTLVPEPSSIGLLLLGAGAFVTARRRRK
jgi:hypothetical protein